MLIISCERGVMLQLHWGAPIKDCSCPGTCTRKMDIPRKQYLAHPLDTTDYPVTILPRQPRSPKIQVLLSALSL